jgi:hypothetical protein
LRRIPQTIALGLFVATIGFWAVKGAHTGWSQNRVPRSKTDEVTGIVYTVYENRYVPGIDLLAGGVGLAGALLAVSFLLRPKNKTDQPT